MLAVAHGGRPRAWQAPNPGIPWIVRQFQGVWLYLTTGIAFFLDAAAEAERGEGLGTIEPVTALGLRVESLPQIHKRAAHVVNRGARWFLARQR